jgi:hypothetical protein
LQRRENQVADGEVSKSVNDFEDEDPAAPAKK